MAMSWDHEGPRVQNLIDVNKTITEIKATADTLIRIRPIPIHEVIFVAVADASLANADQCKSQGGLMCAVAHKDFLNGKLVDFSPITWRSHKLRRAVKASLGSEALSMDDALSELEWLRALFHEVVDPRANIFTEEIFGSNESAMVVRLTEDSRPTATVTDAKALYDAISRKSGQGDCKRAMVDIAVMSHSIKALRAKVFWIPGELMVADSLTKKNGNGTLTRRILRLAQYGISAEAAATLLEGLAVQNAEVKLRTRATQRDARATTELMKKNKDEKDEKDDYKKFYKKSRLPPE